MKVFWGVCMVWFANFCEFCKFLKPSEIYKQKLEIKVIKNIELLSLERCPLPMPKKKLKITYVYSKLMFMLKTNALLQGKSAVKKS